MSKALQAVKATIIGGLVFLVPIVIVIMIFAKVFGVMSALAAPLAEFVPIEAVAGIAVVNIIAVVAILILCFAAGRIAMSGVGRKVYKSLDDKLLTLFPRYGFIKSMTEGVAGEESKAAFKTVLVKLDDQSQIGFEVERSNDGLVVVYFPGSPDPWSGMVAYVTEDRIEPLDASFNDVVGSLRRAGRGATALLG